MATDEELMAELFTAAGLPQIELTPEEQFRAYTTQAFRPASPAREAFWGMRSPLMQQYYLRQPTMTTPGQEYGSFSDYMRQLGTGAYSPPTATDWATQARDAALMAGLTSGQFFEYVSPQERIGDEAATGYMSPEDWEAYQAGDEYGALQITPAERAQIDALTEAQRYMYRQTYGTGPAAVENQLALAGLLARQRTGGGIYGGQYGSAVQRAMGELQGQYQARSPGGNFLDWYLARTGTGGGTAGLMKAAAERRAAAAAAQENPLIETGIGM